MKNFDEKFQTVFMAVAFAELGEFETAREIITEKRRERGDQKRDVQNVRKMSGILTPKI
jgi:hypothetical protein